MRQRHGDLDILLVEDDPGDARLAAEVLKECPVPTMLRLARDGVEALRYLKECTRPDGPPAPDLVLLDLNLPGKGGREVLAEIKIDPVLRRLPVIVLTTSQEDTDVFNSYDLHANCYISKPVDLDEFVSILRSITEFWGRVVRLPPRLR